MNRKEKKGRENPAHLVAMQNTVDACNKLEDDGKDYSEKLEKFKDEYNPETRITPQTRITRRQDLLILIDAAAGVFTNRKTFYELVYQLSLVPTIKWTDVENFVFKKESRRFNHCEVANITMDPKLFDLQRNKPMQKHTVELYGDMITLQNTHDECELLKTRLEIFEEDVRDEIDDQRRIITKHEKNYENQIKINKELEDKIVDLKLERNAPLDATETNTYKSMCSRMVELETKNDKLETKNEDLETRLKFVNKYLAIGAEAELRANLFELETLFVAALKIPGCKYVDEICKAYNDGKMSKTKFDEYERFMLKLFPGKTARNASNLIHEEFKFKGEVSDALHEKKSKKATMMRGLEERADLAGRPKEVYVRLVEVLMN